MVFQAVDLIWYGAVAVLIFLLLGKILPIKKLQGFRKKLGSKVGTIGIVVLVAGTGIISISSLNPWLDTGLWNQLPENIKFWDEWINENPSAGTGHMKYNQEKAWSDVDISFDVRNGMDQVSHALVSGTPAFKIFRGTLGSLTVVYTGALSSGTGVTSKANLQCGEIIYLGIATDLGSDEEGDDPEKCLMYMAVVQGYDGADKPTYCKLGLGYFDYYYLPDANTDSAFNIVDKDKAEFTAAGADLKIDYNVVCVNGKVTCYGKFTFASQNYGMRSYYDWQYQHGFYNWYISIKFTYNSSGDATIASPIQVTSTAGQVWGANIGNDKGFAIQLTTGSVLTDNVRPMGFYYDTDESGQVCPGDDANQYFEFTIDLSGCGINDDDDQEYSIAIECGTHYSGDLVAQAGTIADLGGSYDNYNQIAESQDCDVFG